jgi:hypothetical protein
MGTKYDGRMQIMARFGRLEKPKTAFLYFVAHSAAFLKRFFTSSLLLS